MTNPVFPSDSPISDEMLVAYLDDALSAADRTRVDRALAADADLQQRLADLDFQDLPLAQSLNELLHEAPQARLEAQLRDLFAAPAAPAPPARHARPRKSPGWVLLAASVLLALGVGAGGGIYLQPILSPPQAPGWRATVASYVALYTPQSFDVFDHRPEEQDAALAVLAAKFGVALDRDRLEAPGLSLQQAQALRFQSKPLAQIAFLHDTEVPVALCLIPSDTPDIAPRTETRGGLSVVHWVRDGVGYMVIGDLAFDVLEPIARDLARRLG